VSPDVLFDEIPQPILEEVRLGIQHYFVPLLVISPEDRSHPVDLAGSGTLVELAGRHYILTADHVWNKTEGWAQIGLVLEMAGGAPLAIPVDWISAQRLARRNYSEWGPDIALLELPPQLVATISARKSFMNFAKRRSELSYKPPQMDKSLWALIGLVGQASEVKSNPEIGMVDTILRAEAFFGVTCKEERRDGYDYLTTYAKTTLPGVPSSFKGLSGGGLWQVVLKINAGTIIWPGELHFRGVAFWEQPEPPDHIAIRCHGPQSIFDIAWKAWGLSSG